MKLEDGAALKKSIKDGGVPIAGFSNLIKRDFFNREPPKRQPMQYVKMGS